MSEKLERFIKLLRDMFELEKSDLDFGIYRIMNIRKNEINNFIENTLASEVNSILSKYTADNSQVRKRIEEKSYSNISIEKSLLPEILQTKGWYTLFVPKALMEINSFDNNEFFESLQDSLDMTEKLIFIIIWIGGNNMEVLVIVDVQNDFISGVLGTKEAEAIIEPLINKINSFNGIVLITKDTHEKNYLSTQEGQKLPVEHCIRGTFGWDIDSRVMEAIKEKGLDYKIFEKDTFGSISLGEHIVKLYNEGKIEQIEFVGVCTDICVISNALLVKAMLPEVPIRVDATCCAGVTPKTHEAALITMESCQIEII